MIQLDFSQRWRDRRSSFRRDPSECIRTADYEVASIDGKGSDTIAGDFVRRHHYSASFPAAQHRFGLYRHSALVGVAVFSVPCRAEVITKPLGISDFHDGVDLGRFVLLDDVPFNGETWFLARAFESLRKFGLAGAVSMSDPEPRTTAAGKIVFPGHVGTIYQAFNGVYLGRTKPRTLRLLPDGTVFSDRAASKIRGRERGWRYAVDDLVAAGARAPRLREDLGDWMRTVLPTITRGMRHGGNHRYAWGFAKSVKRRLVAVGPSPRRAA